jgi:hypothetical protein
MEWSALAEAAWVCQGARLGLGCCDIDYTVLASGCAETVV